MNMNIVWPHVFLPFDSDNLGGEAPVLSETVQVTAAPQATVIPGADSLIGDLLDMDLGGPTPFQQQHLYQQMPQSTPVQSAGMDLLGEGLDSLVSLDSLLSSVKSSL